MNLRALLRGLREYGGYALFGLAVWWVARRLPEMKLSLAADNLLIAGACVLAMLSLEFAQFQVFLGHHHVKISAWRGGELLTRKAILNAVAPAQAGTLVLMNALSVIHGVRWRHFVRFTFWTSAGGVLAGIAGLTFLVAPPWVGAGTTVVITALALAGRTARRDGFPMFGAIWITSVGLLLIRVPVFYILFATLESSISWRSGLLVASILSAVNQLPITPGNLGVREFTIGGVSEAIGVDAAVGIAVGLLFLLVRITIYAAVYLVTICRRQLKRGDNVPIVKSTEAK